MFNKRTYAPIILITLLVVLVASCSIERKFAREFIKNDTTRTVLVMQPEYLFMNSLKEWEIDSADEMTESELDSLLWVNSRFLQYINDSMLLHYYVSNYILELEELGFKVYGEDSLMSFLSGQKNAFIVNMAQLEVEEYIMPIKEEEQFGDYIYYEVIDLNAINLNSWFEISRVNEEEDKALFFASHYLTDELEGYFRYYWYTGEVAFNYEVDTIPMMSIYSLSALAGYRYAGYTSDYLMNKYIDKRMEQEGRDRSKIYYHWNRIRKYIAEADEEDRFIPME